MKRMKSNLKFLAIIAFVGFSLQSCENDEDLESSIDQNSERFEGLEIGNTDFKVPQFNPDLHIEFDYTGKTKVKKIYFDINPVNVSEPSADKVNWEVLDYLVPESYYLNQLNPHIHYHILFDSSNETFPTVRPSEGVYNLKITVIEEDNSESYITKEFEIIKKFSEVEVGADNKVIAGSDEIDTEFYYNAGSNTISEIKYELWFEEWREGQNVAVGEWDTIVITLPENLYENQSNPHIHYHMAIDSGFPLGDYWLNIYVQEQGEEAVKLSVPLSIVE